MVHTSVNKDESRVIITINSLYPKKFIVNYNPETSSRRARDQNVKDDKEMGSRKENELMIMDLHEFPLTEDPSSHPVIKSIVNIDEQIANKVEGHFTIDYKTDGIATARLFRYLYNTDIEFSRDTYLKNCHWIFESSVKKVYQRLYQFKTSANICIGDIPKDVSIIKDMKGVWYFSERAGWINISSLTNPLANAPTTKKFKPVIDAIKKGETVESPKKTEVYHNANLTHGKAKEFVGIVSQYIKAYESHKIDHKEDWCIMYQYIDNYYCTGDILSGGIVPCIGLDEEVVEATEENPPAEEKKEEFRVVVINNYKNTKQVKNEENDKFYTCSDVVDTILKLAKNNIDFDEIDLFIEPSAGDGAILKRLPKNKRKGYDLVPEDGEIIEQDFFTTNENDEDTCGDSGRVMYLANPPFGFASNMAIKFFNHCAKNKNAQYIAFIIPRTFDKVSVQNKLSLDFTCELSEPLRENAFLLNGEPYDVPCLFQIWRRLLSPREPVEIPENIWFDLTNSEVDADFFVRRTGGRAGQIIDAEVETSISKSSTHFIKVKDGVDVKQLKKDMDKIDFSEYANATAGVKSVSVSEILIELETLYGKPYNPMEERWHD